MLWKLWKRDVFRNKLITLKFFQDTAAPDFVQMHIEAVD